ncbi:MAG: hypothetical protein JXR63_00680 [Spirochaetales bacterium]|nr:hypothetical protein [Spirochaetales bacterium]
MKKLLIILTIIAVISCKENHEEPITKLRISTPERVEIYTSGDSVFYDIVEISDFYDDTIFLPLSIKIESLVAFAGSDRIKYYTIKKLDEEKCYAVSFPLGTDKSDISVRYSDRSVNWYPRLDIDVQDTTSAILTLNAIITSKNYEIKDCEIILVRTSDTNFLDNLGERYEIGEIAIEKNQTLIYSLQNFEESFEKKYKWFSYKNPDIYIYISFENPFLGSIEDMNYSLQSKNVVLDTGNITNIGINNTIDIYAGVESKLFTHRSAATYQDDTKKRRPFNHKILFNIDSSMKEKVVVELHARKQYGDGERNIYNFGRKPDSMPGNYLIWNLTVSPGESSVIEFNFDSTTKDIYEYKMYDDYAGGR